MGTKALIKLAGGFTSLGSGSCWCLCTPKVWFCKNRTNEPKLEDAGQAETLSSYCSDPRVLSIVWVICSHMPQLFTTRGVTKWSSCCKSKHILTVPCVFSRFKDYKMFTLILTRDVFGQTRVPVRPLNDERGGVKRKCESNRTGVSGILSANRLIYHRPRCYGNQHSGQITGCWSRVFLLIFLLSQPGWRDLWVYPACIRDRSRRRGLGKRSL